MGVYIYKINGKTFKATDIKNGNRVEIAFAPFWSNPYREWYYWFNNIKHHYDNVSYRYANSIEAVELRDDELRGAGLCRAKYNEDNIRRYWKIKRTIVSALKMFEELKARGVQYVVFMDNLRTPDDKNNAISMYELNDCIFWDTPRYEAYFNGYTEKVGVLEQYGKTNIFTPHKEIQVIPSFR